MGERGERDKGRYLGKKEGRERGGREKEVRERGERGGGGSREGEIVGERGERDKGR